MIGVLVVGILGIWVISTGRLTAILKSLTTDPAKAGSSFGDVSPAPGLQTGPCAVICQPCWDCMQANPGAHAGNDPNDPCAALCGPCDDCSASQA